jgi:hypothetical protein
MDTDFTLVLIITCIFIGFIVLFVWIKSRTKRRIIKAVAQAQEALNLTPVASKHPQLGTVWYAVRGQVSGLMVKIFGGKSRRGRNAVATESAMATPIDRAFVMIIVTLPKVIPFSFNIQRRLALSTPRFGTSYEEFDKIVEVLTDDEKKALRLLNNEQLRTAIISFIKLTAHAFITRSEVMIKVSTNNQVLPAVREAVKLATILGNQV